MRCIKKLDRRKNKTGNYYNRWALFLCEYCNKEVEKRYDHGLEQKSCGCCKTKHGDATNGKRTRLYCIWHNMNQRCYNPNYPWYKNWGGRGISGYKQWKEYIPFKTWALNNGYSGELQIDRKNNNENYCPDNCRWVTSAVNGQNKRTTKLNWKKVKKIREILKSNNYTQIKIADMLNVHPSTISNIINYKTWKE